MLISKNLLALLNPQLKSCSFEQLKTAFMAIGVEVEASYQQRTTSHLTYAYVQKVTFHPQSSKLKICQVRLANEEIRTIVCGDHNVRANLKVVVALPGAQLPNGLGIGVKTIRGVVSEGMICSWNELSVVDHNLLTAANKLGIIELEADFDWKQPFDPQVLGLDDLILDLAIPTNRHDFRCGWGLVVGLSQKLGLKFHIPSWTSLLSYAENRANKHWEREWIIDNKQGVVSAFYFQLLTKVKVVPSKWVIQSLLLNNNIKPVNCFVDYGNLITILFNQPVHFHDADQIAKKTIKIIKNCSTTMVDCHNQIQPIVAGDITIVDGNNQVIALGGVVGSQKTAITKNTKNIILELIIFNHNLINQTKNRLKIDNQATTANSHQKTTYFSLLAVHYLGQKFSSFTTKWVQSEWGNLPPKGEQLTFHVNPYWITQFLGIWQNHWITKIYSQLVLWGWNPQNIKNENGQLIYWKLTPPPWRTDVTNAHELAEEIANIIGIDKIGPTKPTNNQEKPINNEEFFLWQKIRRFLLNQGLAEAKTYNLQPQKLVAKFNFMNWPVSSKIINPQKEQNNTLRLHGLISLLKVSKYNHNKQNKPNPWFELIPVQLEELGGCRVVNTLNLIIPISPTNNLSCQKDFCKLKTWLEEISWMANSTIEFTTIGKKEDKEELVNTFIPHNSLAIYDTTNKDEKKLIGYCGQLNTTIIKSVDLNWQNPYLAALLLIPNHKNKLVGQPYSPYKFPSSFQDFSFNKPNSKLLGPILAQIKNPKEVSYVVGLEILEETTDPKQQGVNYLIRVQLNAKDRTLTEVEIKNSVQQIKTILKKQKLVLR